MATNGILDCKFLSQNADTVHTVDGLMHSFAYRNIPSSLAAHGSAVYLQSIQ
jgi:hypothetical protein